MIATVMIATINTIAQIATVTSVIVAVWAIRSAVRESHKQSQLNSFITYAQRYEQIMDGFPEYGLRFDLSVRIAENEQVRLAAIKYLNLVSEEYYLWQKKYIDDEVWKIWEAEIIRTLQSPVMIREWNNSKGEYKSSPEFSRFVERQQSQAASLSV